MGTRTPSMNNVELKDYLTDHLSGEMQWLLRAATEWHIQRQLSLEIDGYSVQVYAMDSAFLHARTLFEFLIMGRTTNNYYTCNDFRIAPRASALYTSSILPHTNSWSHSLHSYLMHTQDRSNPQQLTSFDRLTTKNLNQMPVDFAQEIVRLWRDFTTALASSSDPFIKTLSPLATAILNDAIANAQKVILRKPVREPIIRGVIPPVTW